MLEQGVEVNYINFFLLQPYQVSGNDPNDPAYWESILPTLGYYNGYRFLFSESAVGVDTNNYVQVGNIPSSISWTNLATATFNAVFDYFVNGAADTIKTVIGTLSDFFSVRQYPLQVSYGSTDGYIQFAVSGTQYFRDVFIRDLLNRIPGYAYYIWGYTQQAVLYVGTKVRWPYATRPGGTYEYMVDWDRISTIIVATPGFYGNTALFASIYSYYTNTYTWATHNEFLDVSYFIANLFN